MRFVQDCVNTVSLLVLCTGAVLLSYAVLRRLQRLDTDTVTIGKCSITMQGCLCLLSGEILYGFYRLQTVGSLIITETILSIILLAVLAGCLVAACIMDLESCMVYNYVWWAGGMAGTAFLCLGKRDTIPQLVIYVLLQELLFSRMYGRADCHAFGVCAMVEASFGMTMQAYLIQMLLAFGTLAIVQGLLHNIGRDGNLKRPVAFLPYITVSFWLVMLLYAAFVRAF